MDWFAVLKNIILHMSRYETSKPIKIGFIKIKFILSIFSFFFLKSIPITLLLNNA